MRPGTRVPVLPVQALRIICTRVTEQEDGCLVSSRTPSQTRPCMEILGGKKTHAARIVAAYFHDRVIEPDEDVHHTCENGRCVKPDHLVVEKHVDHIAHHAEDQRRTHCSVHGTPYDRVEARGWGVCNACRRAATAAYRQRKAAAAL